MEGNIDYEFTAPQYVTSLEIAAIIGTNESDSFFDENDKLESATTPSVTPLRDLEEGDEENTLLVRATPGKKHSMLTRLDVQVNTPVRQLRNREVVLMPPPSIKKARKRKATASPVTTMVNMSSISKWDLSGPAKAKKRGLMTLAEQIYHFQKDTPPRFHSQWKTEGPPQCKFRRLSPTKPHTPKLATQFRARQNCIEEISEKSPPVPKIIISECSPQELKHAGRIKTVPHPNEPFVFKAKAESKHPLTRSTTDSLVLPGGQRRRLSSTRSTTSIYDRSCDMLRKKEEKIKKMVLEQTHHQKFHANPLPSYLALSSHSMASSTLSLASRHSIRCNKMNSVARSTFKPKFPSVLYKAPFVPKKPSENETLTELKEINLNTERRARERQMFDHKVKDKQERLEKLVQESKVTSSKAKQPKWVI